MCLLYTRGGGGALCYLGAGRQLHTSQVKTELKTKPHSKLNTRVLQGLSMTPFLPPFPPKPRSTSLEGLPRQVQWLLAFMQTTVCLGMNAPGAEFMAWVGHPLHSLPQAIPGSLRLWCLMPRDFKDG